MSKYYYHNCQQNCQSFQYHNTEFMMFGSCIKLAIRGIIDSYYLIHNYFEIYCLY